ncbi:PEP-CTERM protein-sorting domain-containing protein [Rubritalea squalenifaciens DSM 18772]|uniref:PEP-CTERM protein-sorting domain-containing protein n=1 Tax=Rubritalea squalenifaciens DSM 18772 TaxID=1123071 RepID=A0A1M6N9U6_9BACT|nr:PEP-CTERM sorting domain-containing protein [Rubritalea squalenifaciens]SHJ92463.1 PEP-CTERM protein-sorting domain-containing protein [Rubritalea squalenifaciens DSM 18772]
MKTPISVAVILASLSSISSTQAATVFSADFSGSTTETSATNATPSGNTATTSANLNSGTSIGSWETPTTSATQDSQVLISNGSATGMSGNFLLIGASNNTATFGATGEHNSFAELNLTSSTSLTGTSINFDATCFNTGGQPGGMLVTGRDLSGNAIFTIAFGNGGFYQRNDLSTVNVDVTGTSNITSLGIENNLASLWPTNGTSSQVTINLDGADYTAGNGVSSITGSYFNTNDLASLEFRAVDSKAQWGIDNISVTSVPEPSGVAMLGLGAAVFLLRKRRA